MVLLQPVYVDELQHFDNCSQNIWNLVENLLPARNNKCKGPTPGVLNWFARHTFKIFICRKRWTDAFHCYSQPDTSGYCFFPPHIHSGHVSGDVGIQTRHLAKVDGFKKVRGQPGSQMPWIGRCTLYLASDWLWLCPFLRWITNFIALPTGLLSVKPMTARQKSNWTRDQIRAAGAKGSLTFNESPQAAMLLFPDVCLLLWRSWTMSESGKWSKMWVNLHFNYILLVQVG